MPERTPDLYGADTCFYEEVRIRPTTRRKQRGGNPLFTPPMADTPHTQPSRTPRPVRTSTTKTDITSPSTDRLGFTWGDENVRYESLTARHLTERWYAMRYRSAGI